MRFITITAACLWIGFFILLHRGATPVTIGAIATQLIFMTVLLARLGWKHRKR